jgi:DNA-binding response OmpR family regulator
MIERAWIDPLRNDPPVIIAERQPLMDVSPVQPLPLQSILLVEDDQSVLDTFARMLRLEGYDVQTSPLPEEGLRRAQGSSPDAIILDFRMPLLDGLGFLRHLRAITGHRHTPVAIVTGDYFLDDTVTAELQELGAQILFKPLWLEQLVELARELVARSAANKRNIDH